MMHQAPTLTNVIKKEIPFYDTDAIRVVWHGNYLRYLEEDTLVIDTKYIPSKSAKLMFEYVIRRESDNEIVLEAETTQLFLTREGKFELSSPEFLVKWREKIKNLH